MSPPLELPANDHKSTIDVGHALRMLDDVHKARPVGPAKEKENEQESVGATFVHSLAYDLVEARVDGVLQFYDHSGKTRLGLCSTPDQAQFGSNRWLAQQAGSAGATALTFLLLRKAFGGGAQAQSVGRSVTTAALTGAVYQGVFTPSKASGSNADFFKGRLENAGIGAATFATLDGSARGLGLLGRQGSLSLLKSGVVGSTLAGLPAGFVSTELSTGGKASKEQIGQSMFTYAMIGGAFGIAHSLKSAATPETGKVETAAVVKPALEPVPVVKPTMVEKALAAGAGASGQVLAFVPENVAVTTTQPGGRAGVEVPNTVRAVAPRVVETVPSIVRAVPGVVETTSNVVESLPERSEVDARADQAVHRVGEVVPLATLAAEMKAFPSARDFKELLGDRAAGTLPSQLAGDNLSQGAAFDQLDRLAKMLRSLDCILPPYKKQGLAAVDLGLPDFKIQLGDNTVNVHKIGIGETASVYRLSANGKDFAFKVLHDPERIDVHGSYSEAGALTFLSQFEISDLVKFHAANPGASGGWLLNDFVSKPVTQSGVKLQAVLNQHGLRLGDDWSANRGPGNIIWDVGGIEPGSVGYPSSLSEFRDLLASEHGKTIAGRRMEYMAKSQVKEALMLALQHPDATGQVARSAARLSLAPADLADVLSLALKTPGAAGRAAFELDYLRGSQFIRPLYYEALKNPEARIEAAKQIDRLAPEDRKDAIVAAFQYPECRPMAARAIASLASSADRADVLQLVSTDPGVRITLALQSAVPVDQGETVNGWLNQYVSDFGLIPTHH